MNPRCDSLYTFPKANLVPRYYQLVPAGESWCWAAPAGDMWDWLVEPGEIVNVGYNTCSSV